MRAVADIRYAVRTLANSPGFVLIAILSLALGIGANSAAFSYVDAILLRPLPAPDSGRIIAVDSTAPGTHLGAMSYPDYADLRDRTKTLHSLVAYSMIPMAYSVNRDASPKFNLGVIVSGNFFLGLGIETPVGRSFRADEDSVTGRDLVAIISHSMWERDYGSSPSAIGQRIRVNGADFTILGVAPEGFTGPEAFLLPDVYVPMHSFEQAIPTAKSDFLTARDNRRFNLLGLLSPGASEAQAAAELSTIAAQIAAQYPETNKDRTVTALSYLRARYQNDPPDAQLAIALVITTGLVLLIACANVANLVLARGTARVKEIAIRMAIGAGRGTLLRQLLTESLVLAIVGGLAGLVVGYACVRFLNSIPVPSDFPLALGVRMDQRMLWFSLAISLATGIVFGLLPALRATRTDLASSIKTSDQAPSKVLLFRGKLTPRNFLVVLQLTLSVVLLMLSAFFVRGFQAARKIEIGFRIDHTLFFSLDPSSQRYSEAKTRQFYKELKDRLKDVPGVQNAALSSSIPFSTNQNVRPITIDGYQMREGEDAPKTLSYSVDEDYFPLMQVPMLRGRTFTAQDTADSPKVAIVNEELARRLFPKRNALGKRIRFDSDHGPEVQIVGIAKTGKYFYWAEAPQMALWLPSSQDYSPGMYVEVRTAGDPASLSGAARAQVQALDRDIAVHRVSTLESFYEQRAMLGPRIIAQILTATGMSGLLLAVIGLYGVVAFSVSRRTREIGIRMAIGARPGDVLKMVLRQGMAFAFVGIAIGLAIMIPLLRGGVLQTFAVGVSPYDPSVVAGIPAILAAVMLAATAIPARRASHINPMQTLRIE